MHGRQRRRLRLAAAVGVPIALIALFTWILTAGAGRGSTQNPSVPFVAPSMPVSPSSTASSRSAPHAPRSTARVLPLQDAPGYGWGTSATPHQLVLEVVTTARVFSYMGWRVPTAISSSGLASMTGTHWSRTFTVYGAPYFAQFYVQYGPNTGAVTCRITVDGRQRATHTGYGRYGGIWCFG